TAWGEEAATEGFPNEELAFIDGWTVTFDHWVTGIQHVELADLGTEAVVLGDDTLYVADWTKVTAPAPILEATLPAGRYKFSYAFVPVEPTAQKLTDVDDAIVQQMATNRWNTYIDATATKGAETVRLRWGMHNPTRYRYCANGIDDSDGVAVPDGKDVEAGIFVHLDHAFWDHVGTEESNLRFDVIAAWAQNGETALADLANVSIANIEGRDGVALLDASQRPLSYDDSGLGLAKLREFIVFSTSLQGHLNGEGQCTAVPLTLP
nr:hypothetical protein [Deltaproteobacteria bacterium]